MSTVCASNPAPSRYAALGQARAPALAAIAAGLPLLFIVLWSSGYVAGRIALACTGPFTLLTLRFGIAALALLAIALATGAPWPRGARAWGHLAIVGLLMQVLHFSAIYLALREGLSAGAAALVIGLMPLATTLGAHVWLGERAASGWRQVLTLAGGFAGVLLVVASRSLAAGWQAWALALLGLAGLVTGTLWQKRHCAGMDLRTGSFAQMAVSTLAVALFAGLEEGFALQWSAELAGASLWLALVNSIGAFSLMFLMIKRGQAGQVARLFYLIPGASALLGFAVLGEQLPGLAIAGFALSALAVAGAQAGAQR